MAPSLLPIVQKSVKFSALKKFIFKKISLGWFEEQMWKHDCFEKLGLLVQKESLHKSKRGHGFLLALSRGACLKKVKSP